MDKPNKGPTMNAKEARALADHYNSSSSSVQLTEILKRIKETAEEGEFKALFDVVGTRDQTVTALTQLGYNIVIENLGEGPADDYYAVSW